MQTIFDTLNQLLYRKAAGLWLGDDQLKTLQDWVNGYISACVNAEREELLNTKNGISIRLLRDYVAMQENNRSVAGIESILLKATGGDNQKAWTLFYRYLDEFQELDEQSALAVKKWSDGAKGIGNTDDRG